jgi:uncharacterized protein
MTVRLYTFVDLYTRALATADHLLTKGEERAEALGVGESEMLNWRLIEDMQSFGFQLMVVCNFAQLWPARVAGLDVPLQLTDPPDVTGFRTAIASASDFLAGLHEEQFEGRDAVQLTFEIAPDMQPTMPAERWLTVFATTNIYFHLSTAYGILRARGAQLGKADLFSTGL